jgi:hypothetical protein
MLPSRDILEILAKIELSKRVGSSHAARAAFIGNTQFAKEEGINAFCHT